MKFEKRSFMGINLDVLVGHPEHELMFIANQVAHAAGLKDTAHKARDVAKTLKGYRASDLLGGDLARMRPEGMHPPVWHKVWIFPESTVYQMLLRGNAPQSEPFRHWVTEEVLPSIRKTGKYNAEESSNPIAQAIVDQLKALEGIILKQGAAIEAMRQELSVKTFSLQACGDP